MKQNLTLKNDCLFLNIDPCLQIPFLEKIETPQIASIYQDVDKTWNRRRELFNQTMIEKGLPLRAANMTSVWSLYYTDPSRYNWMLQYYLRAEGLALSWVGTGRLIFSLIYSDAEFEEVLKKFVAACEKMKTAQWFWAPPQLELWSSDSFSFSIIYFK